MAFDIPNLTYGKTSACSKHHRLGFKSCLLCHGKGEAERLVDPLLHNHVVDKYASGMYYILKKHWAPGFSILKKKICRNTRAEFVLQNDEQLFHYYRRTVQPGQWCPQLVWLSLTAWKCHSGDLSLTSHLRGLVSQRSPWYLPSAAAQGAALNCTRTIPGSKNTLGDIFSSCRRLWSFTEINGLIEE